MTRQLSLTNYAPNDGRLTVKTHYSIQLSDGVQRKRLCRFLVLGSIPNERDRAIRPPSSQEGVCCIFSEVDVHRATLLFFQYTTLGLNFTVLVQMFMCMSKSRRHLNDINKREHKFTSLVGILRFKSQHEIKRFVCGNISFASENRVVKENPRDSLRGSAKGLITKKSSSPLRVDYRRTQCNVDKT